MHPAGGAVTLRNVPWSIDHKNARHTYIQYPAARAF